MTDKKDSPNSATIVAQLDASRKGVKAKFCLRFRVASAVLTLLISAAVKLFGYPVATNVAQLEEGVPPGASSAAFSEGRLSGPALAKYR